MAEGDEPDPRRRRRSSRGGRQADRQAVEPVAGVADGVGIADANLGHPVLLGERAGDLTVERGVQLGLNVQLVQAHARRGLDAVGTDHDVGVTQQDVRIHVRRPLGLLDDLADLLGQLPELRRIGAEDFHFDLIGEATVRGR